MANRGPSLPTEPGSVAEPLAYMPNPYTNALPMIESTEKTVNHMFDKQETILNENIANEKIRQTGIAKQLASNGVRDFTPFVAELGMADMGVVSDYVRELDVAAETVRANKAAEAHNSKNLAEIIKDNAAKRVSEAMKLTNEITKTVSTRNLNKSTIEVNEANAALTKQETAYDKTAETERLALAAKKDKVNDLRNALPNMTAKDITAYKNSNSLNAEERAIVDEALRAAIQRELAESNTQATQGMTPGSLTTDDQLLVEADNIQPVDTVTPPTNKDSAYLNNQERIKISKVKRDSKELTSQLSDTVAEYKVAREAYNAALLDPAKQAEVPALKAKAVALAAQAKDLSSKRVGVTSDIDYLVSELKLAQNKVEKQNRLRTIPNAVSDAITKLGGIFTSDQEYKETVAEDIVKVEEINLEDNPVGTPGRAAAELSLLRAKIRVAEIKGDLAALAILRQQEMKAQLDLIGIKPSVKPTKEYKKAIEKTAKPDTTISDES